MHDHGIIFYLGQTDYRKAWEIQLRLLDERLANAIPDVVLLLEHPHVITLGRRGNRSNLKISEKLLEEMGIPVIKVERGGDVTYHGPGQAVVYPILDLKRKRMNVSDYVAALERVISEVLRDYSIEATLNHSNRGVWVGRDKIASIGIALRRWVSYHGIAFNYNTDLKYFDLINACGLIDQQMTSLANLLGKPVAGEGVFNSLILQFMRMFNSQNWRCGDVHELEGMLR